MLWRKIQLSLGSYKKAALIGLLAFAVLQTQWFGFYHSITHANSASVSVVDVSIKSNPSLFSDHKSSGFECKLLGALFLGSFFISPWGLIDLQSNSYVLAVTLHHDAIKQSAFYRYRSQAPPAL